MKVNISAILLLFICFVSTASAQRSPEAYRVGIAANLPVINNHTDTFSARTGFGLWGSVEYDLNHHLRFTPTLAYNNFGYNQNYFSDSGVRQSRKITEHYFDAIAELNYLPSPKANSTRINFGMGISFLGGRVTDQPDILGRNITQRTLNNKKSFTPNFLMSLGINAPLSRKIDLGVQYIASLPHKIFPQDVSGRLGTVQIRLSYKLIPDALAPTKPKNAENENQSVSLYNKDSLIVLVRLKENAKRIKMLQNMGELSFAEEERKDALEKNQALVEAFKEKFTLLPVYYFYDTDSKIALEKGFEGILLNEKLERDSSFKLPKKEYIIAEFARQFNEVTQTSGMYGLVIYDDNFKNIPEPFPAFTSNAYGLLSTTDVIGKFQKRLYKYLKR